MNSNTLNDHKYIVRVNKNTISSCKYNIANSWITLDLTLTVSCELSKSIYTIYHDRTFIFDIYTNVKTNISLTPQTNLNIFF